MNRACRRFLSAEQQEEEQERPDSCGIPEAQRDPGAVGLAAAFDGVLTAVGFPYSITAAMDVRDR
jgi:hypothetical protein